MTTASDVRRHRVDLRIVRHLVWRVVSRTVATCVRHRVTGLAAEAAFFALLSLPPLIFALAGSIGFFTAHFSHSTVTHLRTAILGFMGQALTPDTVNSVIRPTLDDVLSGGRFDVISVGFILALWSGSRALNVVVDTIGIMYGLGGLRGIVWARALSFLLYVVGMGAGVIGLPLVFAGPDVVADALPARLRVLGDLYWPIVIVSGVGFLALVYRLAVPIRLRWRFSVPGAVFTLASWVIGSQLLRWVLTDVAHDSTSIYGPLAAPIAVLLWLYILAIMILIGAALNAALSEIWPQLELTRAQHRDLENSGEDEAEAT